MSLVGCGLWTAGTALGHLAARSMSHGDSQWLRLGGPDAIAALSVLASLLLFAYTRTATGTHGGSWISAWPTWCSPRSRWG